MKILIVGASGFIGSALHFSLAKKTKVIGTYYKNYVPGTYYLDANSPDNIKNFLKKHTDIDFIILSHGVKDLVKCENDYSLAYQNNVQQTINIVESLKCFNNKARVIYISSNYVFDGKKGLYKEYDKKNPRTIYGKTKSLAEDYLISQDVPWTIIRTSSVIGLKSSFISYVKRESLKKNKIFLYKNVNINPTPATMLMDFFDLLVFDSDLNSTKNQILHFVDKKIESKYSFVINNYKVLSLEVEIEPIISESPLYFENLTMKVTDKFYSQLSSSYDKYLRESLTEN